MRKTLMIGVIAGLFVSNSEAMTPDDEVKLAEAEDKLAHAEFTRWLIQKGKAELDKDKKGERSRIQKFVDGSEGIYYVSKGLFSGFSSATFSTLYTAALLPGFASIWGRAIARNFVGPSAAFLLTGGFVSALNHAINGSHSVMDSVNTLHNTATRLFERGCGQFKDAGNRFDKALKRYKEEFYAFFRRENKGKDDNTSKIGSLRRRKIDLGSKKREISEKMAARDREIYELEEQQINIQQKENKLLSLKNQKELKASLTKKIANLTKRIEDEGHDSGYEDDGGNVKKLEEYKNKLVEVNEKISTLKDEIGKEISSLKNEVEALDSLNKEWNKLEEKIIPLEKERNDLGKEEESLDKDISSVNSELLWRFWGKKGIVDPALKIGSVAYSAFLEGLRFVDMTYHFGAGVALCGTSILSCAVGFPSLIISCAPGFLSPLVYDALRYCGVGKTSSLMFTGVIASISNFMTYGSGAWDKLNEHLSDINEEGIGDFGRGLLLFSGLNEKEKEETIPDTNIGGVGFYIR